MLRVRRTAQAMVVQLLALGAALAAITPQVAQAQTDPELQALVGKVQAREDSIGTIRGYLLEAEYFQGPVDMPENTLFQVEFVLGQGTARYDACALETGVNHWGVPPGIQPMVTVEMQDRGPQTVPGETPRIQVCENGTDRIAYDNVLGQVEVKPQPGAPRAVARSPFSEALLFGSGADTWGETLSAMLAGTKAGELALEREQQERAGFRCRIVSWRSPHTPAGDTWATRLWVAEELGYAVVRTESECTSADGTRTRATVCQGLGYQEVADGIWLPTETLNQYYKYDAPPGIQTTKVLVFDLCVNEPVTDDDLRIHIPVGALVFDPMGAQLPPGRVESDRAAQALRRAEPPPPDPAFPAP